MVRLVLLAALAIPLIQLANGVPFHGPATLYMLSVVGSPRNMALVLGKPQNLAIMLGVVVGMHFLLWKAERVRQFWHRRLAAIGLR